MKAYQFNIKDYRFATAHLTNEEDLAYRRLLDFAYDTEEPIPDNIPLVSRRLGLGIPLVSAMLKEFFILTENGWIHTRVSEEIEKYHEYMARQKANGSKGGRPTHKDKKPTANPSLTHGVPIRAGAGVLSTTTVNTDEEKTTTTPSSKRARPIDQVAFVVGHGVDRELAEAWVAVRKKKRAVPVSELVMNGVIREAEEAGYSLTDAIRTCCEKGWTSFDHTWVNKGAAKQSFQQSAVGGVAGVRLATADAMFGNLVKENRNGAGRIIDVSPASAGSRGQTVLANGRDLRAGVARLVDRGSDGSGEGGMDEGDFTL